MFCTKCGKNIADNSKFCDGCGAPVTPAAAPAAPVNVVKKQPNQIFVNLLSTIKGFFSNNTVKTVGNAAKSNGLEWLIIFGVGLLVYPLALALNVMQAMDSVLGAFGQYLYSFGIWFLYGIVLSAGSYFLIATAVFLTVKFIFKKNTTYFAALNMVAVASIPLTCVYVLNIIFGFLWTPLVLIFSAIGLVATLILIYAGMQKLDKLESSPFWAYIIICAAVILVIGILAYVFVSSAFSSAASNAMGSISSFF